MSRRFLIFPSKCIEMSQGCDISRMGQEHRKGGAGADFRSDTDKTSLPGDDLTGKIQPYSDAGNIMYG